VKIELFVPLLLSTLAAAPAANAGDDPAQCTTERDFVGELLQLERGLAESADVSASLRDEVAKEIALAKTRIARLTFVIDTEGTALRVDGACAMDEALRAPVCVSREGTRVVLLNPGRRRIALTASGFQQQSYDLIVAAGDDARVHVRASSPHEKERNPFDEPMWIGWGLFGGALVGGTITGIGAARSEEGFASPIGT
jgi:hypothetical protein